MAAFIHRSLTIPKPFLDIRVLKVPTVWLGLIPFFIYQFAGALGTAIASVLANSSQNLTEGVQRVFSLQLFLVVIIYFFFINLFQQLSKDS